MRKGQVTLFVILGILVLLIVGFFIYINYDQQVSVIPPQRTTVSEKFEPVQLLIEDCMKSVAKDAIEKLGKHGGYIDPNNPYLSGRLFYTSMNDQSESDLAYLSEDLDTAIAYWYYSYSSGNCKDCQMMSQAPYISEIEDQISGYVDLNIDVCLDDFQTFRDEGYDIVIVNTITTTTTLRPDDVLLQSKYLIDITYDNSHASVENYVATVDIPLLKYYEMALNISKKEYDSQFLEGLNTYLIMSYSGLNSKLLPPFYSYSSGYNMVYWSKSAVKNNMKDLLVSYVPQMQVKKSKNYHELNTGLTPSERNFIDTITLDLLPDKDLSKTDISFIYTGQDMSFDITPSNNELLGPYKDTAQGIDITPPKNTFTYQFFYDVSYPVIVEITDEYSPGQRYTFMFALESTLKQNRALRDWWNASNRPLYLEHDFFDTRFNNPLNGKFISNPKTGNSYQYKERVTNRLFCDDTQKISGDVYLKTYDASTKQPLEDVDVIFGCGNYATCPLGRTAHDDILDVESFNQKIPTCMNGYLQLKKYGYANKNVKISTSSSNTNLGSIYLEPIRKVNVSVQVYSLGRKTINVAGNSLSAGFIFPNASHVIGANDTAILFLTKITSGLEDPSVQNIFISPDATNTEIELTPGRYILSGSLMVEQGYIIPKKCKSICDSYVLGICTGHKEIPDDPIEIKPALLGGIEMDETNPLVVKREDIDSGKDLTIYLLQLPPPPCIDEMQEMGKLKQLTSLYRTKVMSVFK